MAYIEFQDPDDPVRRRAKVVYDVRDISKKRKRKSKTFPPHTPMRDIKAFMRQVEQDYTYAERLDFTKRTLNDFLKEYFDNYTTELSPNTCISYRRMAYERRHGIALHLGWMTLDKLTTSHVQKYANMLRDEGLSAKTIKNYVSFLHSVYDRAIRCRYVKQGYNVTDYVELPKNRRKQVQSYSADEIRTLLRLIDTQSDDFLRLLVYLAVGTGARRSEMAGLKIGDVDMEKKVWHLTKCKVTVGDVDMVKPPKTDAGMRDIPLSDTLCREIERAISRYEKNKKKNKSSFNDTGYLFSDEHGEPCRTNALTRRYIRFMKKHEDEIRYLPLHSAGRHSYASLAIAGGIDIKCLQEILGHADASVTLNTYANSYFSQKAAYAQSLEETIFSHT